MEKRVTLAFILCVLVTLLFFRLAAPPPPPPRPGGPGAPPAAEGPSPPPPPAEAAPGPPAEPSRRVPRRAGALEETAVRDTPRLRARFSSRGGSLLEIRLKGYYDAAGLPEEERGHEERWLEILRPMEGTGSLLLGDLERSGELEEALWVETPFEDGSVPGVAYEYEAEDGLVYRKEFLPSPDGFDLLWRVVLHHQEAALAGRRRILRVGSVPGIHQEGGASQFFTPFGVTALGRDPLRLREKYVPLNDLLKGPVAGLPGTDGVLWVASFAKYFVAVLEPIRMVRDPASPVGEPVPVDTVSTTLRTDTAAMERDLRAQGLGEIPAARAQAAKAHRTGIGQALSVPVYLPEAGGEVALEFRLFAGPRNGSVLSRPEYRGIAPVLRMDPQSFCPPLSCAIDPLVRLLLPVLMALMGLFHSLTGNWGIAIILLTVLVRLLLFPLSKVQQVSMHRYGQKIQKLKPELDRIKERYKNNRQKMNQEVMALYKQHGVNPVPLAGCLPMLVNLPVFIGLFYTLRTAVELRHAPFVLWIEDLSMPDALWTFASPHNVLFFTATGVHLLPLLMTATWYLQQRSAPAPADPQQAATMKMMRFMPIFFGLILYEYAAGLSLYMFVSSLLGILEQKVIKKRFLRAA